MLGVVVSGVFFLLLKCWGCGCGCGWGWGKMGEWESGRVGDDVDGVGVVTAWDNTGYTIGGRGISVGECNTGVVAYSLEC